MYFVYVLKSRKDGNFYTGFTVNLDRRLQQHNLGTEKSTRFRRPFDIIYYEGCINRKDAMRRELYLKTSWGKRYIKNRNRMYLVKEKVPVG